MSVSIISTVHHNGLTDLPIAQDIYGHFHIINKWETVLPPSVGSRIYIQSLSHGQFPGTDNFYLIPNELTGEPYTKYVTPTGKTLNVFFIMASQDRLRGGKKDEEGPEMSLLGVYVNGDFIMAVPFRYDIHYVLAESLRFPPGAEIEMKIRPYSRRTRVGVLVGGFLLEEDI